MATRHRARSPNHTSEAASSSDDACPTRPQPFTPVEKTTHARPVKQPPIENRRDARTALDTIDRRRAAVRPRARPVCSGARWRSGSDHVVTKCRDIRAPCPNAKRPGGHSVRRAALAAQPRDRLTRDAAARSPSSAPFGPRLRASHRRTLPSRLLTSHRARASKRETNCIALSAPKPCRAHEPRAPRQHRSRLALCADAQPAARG